MNRIQHILTYTARCAIAFMPLIVTPWTLYPFAFGKSLFLHAMSIIMAVCVAILLTEEKWRKRCISVLKEPLTMIWIAFVIGLLVSSVLGDDFSRSWWGTQERGGGLVLMVELVMLHVVLRTTHRTFDEKKIMTRWVVASGVVTSLLAFLRVGGVQLFGVDTGLRLSGTLANPIYFAGALIFYLYFAWYGYMHDTHTKSKWLYSIAAIIFSIAIMGTQTRSILLALAVGAGGAVITALIGYKHLRRYVWGLLCVGVVLIGILITSREYIIEKRIPFLHRVASTSLSDTSLATRVAAWKGGYEAWTDKPIFGWGMEQFTPAFDAHYTPELLKHGLSATRFDRAHNIIIELLVMGGVVALFIYAALFLWPLYQLKKQKTLTTPLGIAAVAVILAHHTHLMFAFDTLASYPLVVLFLVWISTERESRETVEITSGMRSGQKVVVVLAMLTGAYGMYAYVIRPHNHSSALLHTLVFAQEQSRDEAHDRFMRVLRVKTPYPTETRAEILRNVIRGISEGTLRNDQIKTLIEEAHAVGELNMKDHENDSFQAYLNGVLMFHAGTINPSYYDKAHAYFDRAIEISPRQQYMFVKAELYEKQKQPQQALAVYRQALEKSEEVPISKWYVGLMLVQLDQKEEGLALIFEAIDEGFAASELHNKEVLAQLLREHGRKEQAAQYFAYAVDDEKQNPQKWAEFAVYLAEARYLYSASLAAQMAAALDVSYEAEAQAFIEELGDIPDMDEFYKSRLETLIRETMEQR